MGQVTSKIVVNAPIEKVYNTAREIEKFPQFMPDVVEIKIEKRDEKETVSYWKAKVQVASLNKFIEWTERDEWDWEKKKCKFELVKGDYKEYSGKWEFNTVQDGTEMIMVIDFDLGIPLIGPLIQKLLDKKMKENCDNMLKAIKNKVESDS